MTLRLFISSTVHDFGDTRKRLRDHFSRRQMEVLRSEDASFPVERHKDTLEVCLDNVKKADAYVLLIGQRFGSVHPDHVGKSITWLEWEQARTCGLDPIVLVDQRAFRLCRRIEVARKQLQMSQPGLSHGELEANLRARFKDRGQRQSIVDVARFVATIEATGTWMHLAWDGTPAQAIKQVETRLGDLFGGYRRTHLEFEGQLRYERARLDALARTVDVASELLSEFRSGGPDPEDVAAALLKMIGKERGVLLGFEVEERFSIGLHRRNHRGEAVPDTVVRDDAGGVKPRNRTWRKGQSHVSLAMERNQILVSEDVRQSEGWFRDPDEEIAKDDRQTYVSIISVPFYLCSGVKRRGKPSEMPNAALTLTSSRRGHFKDPDGQVELTFRVLSRIVSEVLNAGNGAP